MPLPQASFRITMGMLVIGSIIRPRIFISTSTGSSLCNYFTAMYILLASKSKEANHFELRNLQWEHSNSQFENCKFEFRSSSPACLQEFFHMPPRRVGHARPAHHACQFFDSLLSRQTVHTGDGSSIQHLFLDPILMVGESSDLRQMGYTQHLIS